MVAGTSSSRGSSMPESGEYEEMACQLLDSLLCAERDAAQDRPDDVRHREAEPLVLIGVEVHAIDTARRRHGPGIEELALALFRNGRQCCRQSGGLLCGAFELRRDCTLGFLNCGGATIRIAGTGMPGSIGACRIACTSDAVPCAECDAVNWCID